MRQVCDGIRLRQPKSSVAPTARITPALVSAFIPKGRNMQLTMTSNSKVLKLSALALASALSLSACTDSQQRVAAGGAIGAVGGALIGGAIGGNRGAVIGAIAGGLAGLVIADAIEQQRAREAALYAARTGGSNTQSFRNSKGEAVVVRARTVRTYTASSGQRVRVVERSITRNGQDAGKDTVEAKEVKLASGGSEWTGIE